MATTAEARDFDTPNDRKLWPAFLKVTMAVSAGRFPAAALGSNVGSIVLSTSSGELDLSSVGKYGKESRSGIIHGTFHFTVTGGTGDYAGATGSGTIKATVDHNTGALSSTISGKIHP